MENSSGQGKSAVVPEGIEGWSWGAFFLHIIWGLFNKTYIALLCLVPFIGFFMAIVLGFKGREWAWRNKRWESVEQFNEVQKKWSFWAVLLTVGAFVLGIVAAVLIPYFARKGAAL